MRDCGSSKQPDFDPCKRGDRKGRVMRFAVVLGCAVFWVALAVWLL
jgi:hypothetical protein